MTSLAYYAAPFGGESGSKNDSYLEKKRKNKTLKRNSTLKNHVQSMINEIHKSSDDDTSEDLNDFDGIQTNEVPPTATQSKPSPYTPDLAKPAFSTNLDDSLGDGPVSLETFDNLQNDYAQQYYDQYTPDNETSSNTQNLPSQQKNLIEKLDHIIHLLEESKDEKTGHVTEELVLYSFLGVFIIFIVDSFARAGKYVR